MVPCRRLPHNRFSNAFSTYLQFTCKLIISWKPPDFRYASAFNFCISMIRRCNDDDASQRTTYSCGKCIELRKIYQLKQLCCDHMWTLSVICAVPMSFKRVCFRLFSSFLRCWHFHFAHCRAHVSCIGVHWLRRGFDFNCSFETQPTMRWTKCAAI